MTHKVLLGLICYWVLFAILFFLPTPLFSKGVFMFLLVTSSSLYGGLKWGMFAVGWLIVVSTIYHHSILAFELEGLIGGFLTAILIAVFTGIPVDIIRRKNEELTRSEKEYRTLFKHALNGFAIHRIILNEAGEPIDYIFLDVNRAFEEQTGLSRDEIIGKRVTEVLPGIEEETDFIEVYGEVALTGKSKRIQRYSAPLNRWYDISVYSPEKNTFATFFLDITEHKQTMAALQEKENNISRAHSFANMGTWEYDINNSTLYWSEECAAIFDLQPGEFEGTFEAFLKRVHPEDREYVMQVNTPITENKETITLEYEHRIIRKDGNIRWVREFADVPENETDEQCVTGLIMDITKRKQAELEMRNLLENAPDMMVRFNKNLEHIYCNPAVEKHLGVPDTLFLGKTFSEFAQKADSNSLKKKFHRMEGVLRECLETGREQVIQMDFAFGSEKKYFDTRVVPEKDHNDETISLLAVSRDNTELIHTKEQLQKNEARLRAIIEDQTELICRFNSDGVLTFVNEAYCRYFSKNREELIGTSFLPLIPKEDQHISEEHISTLNTENPVTTYEHRVILPDGSIHWQQWTDRAVFDLQGKILEYQAVGRDITERKKAEINLQHAHNALEEQVAERTRELQLANNTLRREIDEHKTTAALLDLETERLSITLASIGEGIITITDTGKIELFNRQAEIITGWSREEAEGKPPEAILNFKEGSLMLDMCRDNQTPLQETLLTKNKTLCIVDINIQDMRSSTGELIGYVIIIKDITEQKKLERQNITSEKMRAIGQLASGIAHEINTPMQYIGDNIDFLQESFKEVIAHLPESNIDKNVVTSSDNSMEEKAEKNLTYLKNEIPLALEETQQGTDIINKIVGAMKNFSHPGGNGKTIKDINQIVSDTIDISRNEWKYHADLDLDLEKKLPQISCVPSEIGQALLAVVINATQAIKEAVESNQIQQGKLKVSTTVSCEGVIIVVEDNGIGIPKTIQDRIFDLFFTTKEVGVGTGQGLSIAYDIIVNKHNGKLDFNSSVGEGTSFRIILPTT